MSSLFDPYFELSLKALGNFDTENCTMKPCCYYIFQTPQLDGDEGPTVVNNGSVESPP